MRNAYIGGGFQRMKITRKASDAAENLQYIELFGSSTRDHHARRIYRRMFSADENHS